MKKIYYFPGLISAVMIPLLFWHYGNQKFEEINLNIIDIGLSPRITTNDKINNIFTFERVRNWNYKKIKVQPNKAKENSSLYVSEIKKLKEKNQLRTGIEFILNNDNTYGDFVSILNDMDITKAEEYVIDLDKTGHLFVIHSYVPPTAKECFLCNDNVNISVDYDDNVDNWAAYLKFKEAKGYTRFTETLTHLPKEAFFIIFGFLFLINISMFSIKERFQMHY